MSASDEDPCEADLAPKSPETSLVDHVTPSPVPAEEALCPDVPDQPGPHMAKPRLPPYNQSDKVSEPGPTHQKQMSHDASAQMVGTLEIRLKYGGAKGLDQWESVYAVLCGQTLNLYQDQMASEETSNTRWPPLDLKGARCRDKPYYRKKEHTFKIILEDGNHYMFAALTDKQREEWATHIQQNIDPTHTRQDESFEEEEGKRTKMRASDAYDRSKQEKVENGYLEREPPPKPPHTYYNKHRYPHEDTTDADRPLRTLPRSAPPSEPPPPPPPQNLTDPETKFGRSRSVFKKLFKK